MTSSDILRRLEEHQAEIEAVIVAGLTAAERGPQAAPPLIRRRRWQLVRVLRAYQIFKHREIFDPAIAAGPPARAAAARAMKANCIAAGERFRAYVLEWTARDVATDWLVYRTAMQRMVAELRQDLATERRDIVAALNATPRPHAA